MGRSKYILLMSRRQIAALLAALVCVAAVFAVVLPRQKWFNDQPALQVDKVAAASERIDPNTATAASLQRLPSIGTSRAQAIVRYRQEQQRQGKTAFETANDLAKVPGLGKGTVKKIKAYLIFKNPQTTN